LHQPSEMLLDFGIASAPVLIHTPGMDFVLPLAIDQLPRHKQRLLAACEMGLSEPDVLGMAIAGSFVDGTPDTYSDLDIRIVLANGSFHRVFPRREELVRACGPLVAAFTGEHVGEPNLFITLYEDLIHVDYLFAELAEAPDRNDGRRVHVLWQRDDTVGIALSRPHIADPFADLTYLETRMWTWTWYIQSKILRGELWEAVSGLTTLRNVVLFRLLAMTMNLRHRGSRFAEELVGEHAVSIERTRGALDKGSLLDALRTTVRLYFELADPLLAQHGVDPVRAARDAVLPALEAGLLWQPAG
jgi:hypothetical protein